MYLATDSQDIIAEAAQGSANLTAEGTSLSQFRIRYLQFQRSKYDYGSNEPGNYIEKRAKEQLGLVNDVLDESFLDLLLLSRAAVVAGSMMSNLPRLALQMRVTPPGLETRRLPYITLDG